MADKIVQTGIGLPVETLARLDRLRACLGRSRSFVVDYALLNGGLAAVEEDLAVDVTAYNDLADAMGITWQELAERYVEAFGAKTYPPTVSKLCEMWAPVSHPAGSDFQAVQRVATAATRDVAVASMAAAPVVRTLRDLQQHT